MSEIVVTFANEILGKGEFWRGSENDVAQIRNLPARRLAEKAIIENQDQQLGMWKVKINRLSP